jgi:hypothetical protein
MLEFPELIAIFFVFGCPTWLLSKLIDRAFGAKQKQPQLDAKAALDRARALELQLVDARIQNDQLQKQLDWHTRMLTTQDTIHQHTQPSSVTVATASTLADPAGARA